MATNATTVELHQKLDFPYFQSRSIVDIHEVLRRRPVVTGVFPRPCHRLPAVVDPDWVSRFHTLTASLLCLFQEACRERGMRATGLTKQGYVRQLSQWLDLRYGVA